MAAPNIVNVSAIYGNTTASNLTSTSSTTILNNPSGSNKVLKVNVLNVANYGAGAAYITINWNNSANVAGTNFAIVGNVSVPANSTLNVIDKSTQYYIEENRSIGAIAGTANTFIVTCSYEDLS
jgi:hypothetical protein